MRYSASLSSHLVTARLSTPPTLPGLTSLCFNQHSTSSLEASEHRRVTPQAGSPTCVVMGSSKGSLEAHQVRQELLVLGLCLAPIFFALSQRPPMYPSEESQQPRSTLMTKESQVPAQLVNPAKTILGAAVEGHFLGLILGWKFVRRP